MITLITGTPGAGKTAWTVQELTRLPSQRKVYVHGIPGLKLAHSPIFCHDELCEPCRSLPDDESRIYLEDWHKWATHGSLIVCDEIQRVWGISNSASKKSDDITSLQTHRHKGLDFWLISQNPKLLHTSVRTLIGRHIHLVSKWSGRSEYEYPECRDNTDSRLDAVSRPYKLPKQIFDKYRSASLHTKQAHRFPLALYFFVFVVLLVSFFGYRVYSSMNKKISPEVKEQQIIKPGQQQNLVDPVNKSTTIYPDFKPIQRDIPASAPAYAQLIKVTDVPHIIACVNTPEWCRCYTKQAVYTHTTPQFCSDFIAGRIFNPFRENYQSNQNDQKMASNEYVKYDGTKK